MPLLIRQNRGHHPPRRQRQNLDPNRVPCTHPTFSERCQIFSLYRFARRHYTLIANSLKLLYITVWSAIKLYTKTPRKPIGRPPILNIHLRKRLVAELQLTYIIAA
jgi:hypothetical protein